MWSKNKRRMSEAERRHVARVKEQPCAVCGAAGPSEAHEIQQGEWFCSIALCPDCHRGPQGIHGDKTLWRIYKLNEIEALNITNGRIFG